MFKRRRKKDTHNQEIVTNTLPVTIWVDRADTRASGLLDDAVHDAAQDYYGPDRMVLPAAEAMVLRNTLTQIMSELGPHIQSRKEIRDINHEPELNFAVGVYHATEKIRTIVDHMLEE